MKATITLQEAHDLTGVSLRSLYYWMRWGWLPFLQKTSGRYPHRRVQLIDVQRVLEREDRSSMCTGTSTPNSLGKTARAVGNIDVSRDVVHLSSAP